jgi:hypothetical protein
VLLVPGICAKLDLRGQGDVSEGTQVLIAVCQDFRSQRLCKRGASLSERDICISQKAERGCQGILKSEKYLITAEVVLTRPLCYCSLQKV